MTLRRDRDALVVIGWREWVSLPELGIAALKAKVDTGARTSALHAFDVQLHGKRVRFHVHPHQRDDDASVAAEAEFVEHRLVRNSSGDTELRPVVRTLVELGGHRFAAELTLTNRSLLGFRMLLGREALRRRFAVDPGGSYRCGRPQGHPQPRVRAP
ncbi:RimK/LysX family protein [Nannocystis sp.]|uniref:ATP-dependent zinc protease family protein n=1 Tax=Nannocystis sp. TaxID=1962667 RepID=UPI0024210D34|nr:RimK/LysX family protein [Nannocystis sp.]MBK7827931.1 ATP-dependent zinc protease [Nannocystis sp.]MBK9752541.1 ATP-dependent zinc protease [Nannocystis sp.]